MSDVTPPLKAKPDWLDELGPVVEGVPEWQRPEPQCFEGRYCRLEPLSLEDHADDLWAQMAVADPDMRQWMFLAVSVRSRIRPPSPPPGANSQRRSITSPT